MQKLTFKIYPKPGKADKGKKIIKKERPLLVMLSASHKAIEDGKAKTVTKRYKLSSGLEIDPAQWNARRQEPKDTHKDYGVLMNGLKAFKEAVTDACHAIAKEGGEITATEIRARIDGKAAEANKAPELTPDAIFKKAFEDFIEIGAETKQYSTIQVYRTVFTRLKEYESHIKKPLTFEALGPHFHDHYRAWMLKNGSARTGKERLLDDTVNKHFKIIKTFMGWAFDRRMHNNDAYRKFKAAGKSKVEHISLTESELIRLQEMDLSDNKRLERVRDLLIFACYTGQRWSDIEAFSREYIKEERAGLVWRFDSKKTGKHTAIPLESYSSPALAVALKYDYKLPDISQQKFNNYVKELGQLAEINEPIKRKRDSGSKAITVDKPKYAFMSSHIGRRTFVTILLGKGVDPVLISKFTGHDLKTLMRYEQTSEQTTFEAFKNIKPVGESTIRKAV